MCLKGHACIDCKHAYTVNHTVSEQLGVGFLESSVHCSSVLEHLNYS